MKALLAVLKKVDAAIAAAELALALAALLAMLACTALGIVFRSFWWTTSASTYLVLISTFFGASLALRTRRHIQIDLVTRALPKRARAALGVVSWLVAGAILAVLARAAVAYVELHRGDVSKLHAIVIGGHALPDVPLVPILAVMPLTLAIMTFRCALASLEDLRGAVTGDLEYMRAYEHVEGAELIPPAHPERSDASGASDAESKGAGSEAT